MLIDSWFQNKFSRHDNYIKMGIGQLKVTYFVAIQIVATLIVHAENNDTSGINMMSCD